MSPDPTLLLVHGAWCGGWMWQPTADLLRARGLAVEVVDQLPSSGPSPEGLGDLADDAAFVAAAIERVGGPVVLCGHSYGGMVVTELGDHPAIAATVYLAAFWPQRGQSLATILGGGPPPDWQVIRDDGTIAVTDDRPRAIAALFGDLDDRAAQDAYERLVLQSVPSFLAPSAAPAREHPVTYVMCAQDGAIPPAAQAAMAGQAQSTVTLDSAHCPQLSRPAELADVLAGVLAPAVA